MPLSHEEKVKQRETGYYWVHLYYGDTFKDAWEVCHYSAVNGGWSECGEEGNTPACAILEIDERRLTRKDSDASVS